MRIRVAQILTAISIGLLVLYGADVAAGGNTDSDGKKEGILPFDEKTRGFGLGMPALILPIVGFFISRKEPSKLLGALLIASGVLTVGGIAASLAVIDTAALEEQGRNALLEFVPIMAVGGFIIALGIIKIARPMQAKLSSQ